MSSRPVAGGRVQASNLQATSTAHATRGVDGAGTQVGAEAHLPDGQLTAQRDAPLGGQAVLEGVMMRGVRHWAVAVRKPGDEQGLGEIEVTMSPLSSALARHRWLRVPVLRGIVALGGSLAIGFKALGISANAQLPEGETRAADGAGAEGETPAEDEAWIEGGARAESESQEDAQEISSAMWAGTVIVALVFAIGLFFLLPLGLTSLVKGQLHSSALFWIVEGVVRTAIFLVYMVALSRVHSLRRVFEYHGAEHKTISCFEAGLPLTPANAQRFSRLHPRCGTSFLLVVMVVSIFVFGAVGMPAWYWLIATRILGVPVIVGISFEIIKFAGRNRNRRWVQAVMWPGLKLQLLTTREPDLDQLVVAIAALQAVLEHETPGSMSAAELVGVEVVA
jgi:uncharacterized protein YqhQ